MLHRLKRELCFADVKSFTQRALGKCNRVFRAPRAEIAKKSATNSSFDDANFARARRQTRKFLSQNVLSDAAASSVYNSTFCNDAGWISGVLRITHAKILQRIRELLRGKFARSRRSRRLHAIFLRFQTLHRLKREHSTASSETLADVKSFLQRTLEKLAKILQRLREF